MGKKGAAGAGKSKVKKPAPKAGKKNTQFKSLKKQETRQVLVQTDKKTGNQQAKPIRKHVRVNDEFRNFDERMAASRVKKPVPHMAQAAANAVVAPPSFVMPAATFQFNQPQPVQEAPREVEGFHGFLSAMQEPASAPQPSAPRESRKQMVEMPRNVFAVLDDEEDLRPQPPPTLPPPSFMQPATFTFNLGGAAGASATSAGLTSLQRSILGQSAPAPSPFGIASAAKAVEVDPDL